MIHLLTTRSSDLEQRQTLAFALEVKAKDDGSVEGYGSVFGHKDAYSDIVAPGAFKATLAAHKAAGTMPAMLWQHKADEPIGAWSIMAETRRVCWSTDSSIWTPAAGARRIRC